MATLRELCEAVGANSPDELRTWIDTQQQQTAQLSEERGLVMSLSAEVKELSDREKHRDAEAAVANAARKGLVTPKLRKWAINEALNRRESFDEWVSLASPAVDLHTYGSEAQAEPAEVSSAAAEIASKLGVSLERLADTTPMAERMAARSAAA